MDLLDVNILINAYRRDAPRHNEFHDYVVSVCQGRQPFAIPSISLSGFLRIVTHPRIFSTPSTLEDALTFAEQLRALPHCIITLPGPRHWDIFIELCRTGNARGSLVSDAYLAALALEIGAELVTDDRGFSRWPGLRWRSPA
jgi:uncharacterized protein